MKGCVAVVEFKGVWPGWVAVMVTLPSFKPVAVYPSVALPPKLTTVESLLSKVKVVRPESAVMVKGLHGPPVVRYRLEGKDLSTTKGWLGVLVVVGGYQLTDKGVYRSCPTCRRDIPRVFGVRHHLGLGHTRQLQA